MCLVMVEFAKLIFVVLSCRRTPSQFVDLQLDVATEFGSKVPVDWP